MANRYGQTALEARMANQPGPEGEEFSPEKLQSLLQSPLGAALYGALDQAGVNPQTRDRATGMATGLEPIIESFGMAGAGRVPEAAPQSASAGATPLSRALRAKQGQAQPATPNVQSLPPLGEAPNPMYGTRPADVLPMHKSFLDLLDAGYAKDPNFMTSGHPESLPDPDAARAKERQDYHSMLKAQLQRLLDNMSPEQRAEYNQKVSSMGLHPNGLSNEPLLARPDAPVVPLRSPEGPNPAGPEASVVQGPGNQQIREMLSKWAEEDRIKKAEYESYKDKGSAWHLGNKIRQARWDQGVYDPRTLSNGPEHWESGGEAEGYPRPTDFYFDEFAKDMRRWNGAPKAGLVQPNDPEIPWHMIPRPDQSDKYVLEHGLFNQPDAQLIDLANALRKRGK